MDESENTGRTQAGRWPKGVSGNPLGRRHGTRCKATQAAEKLLAGESDALTRKCIEMALGGDSTAMRLCMERIVPAMKSRPIKLKLPPIVTAGDIMAAQSVALAAMSSGEITPDEAATVAAVLEAKRRTIEVVELEKRIAALESRNT